VNSVRSALRQLKDEDRKRASREQLLDAARRVFVKQGYHRTLISEIVSDAQCGQGTFYRNFNSKYEIFETLLDRFIDNMFGQFREMSAKLPTDETEYRQASLNAIARLSELIERERDLAFIFVTEAPTIDAGMETKVAMMFDGFAQLAKFYLDHAIANGFARLCRTEVVSQALVGIARHMTEKWFKGAFNGLPLLDLIREVVDFAFMGFGKSHLKT
jgi:AcrR family transcriptional regulator